MAHELVAALFVTGLLGAGGVIGYAAGYVNGWAHGKQEGWRDGWDANLTFTAVTRAAEYVKALAEDGEIPPPAA